MMQIIKPGININFMGKSKQFVVIIVAIMLLCFGIMLTKKFNLGIDFVGGTVVQVKFDNPIVIDNVREGLKSTIKGDFVIQNFGEPNEVLIRIVDHSGIGLQELSENIKTQLLTTFANENPTIQRIEQVGPQVGNDLRYKAYMAMLYSAIGILVYIALRFEFIFAVGAILSLLHDVVVTMGVYSLMGKEFNLTVMAAVLTVTGYSLNDTIVLFDRIREKVRNGATEQYEWKEIVNMSINETLSRTILTSLLTLLAVASLYIFGGEVLNGFALVMMVGIVAGTYSTIAVSAVFVCLVTTKKHRNSGKKIAPATGRKNAVAGL